MRTLIIDNYDSFTFNLYEALACINGAEPIVVPNDGVTLAEIRARGVDNIVISPGPGRPERVEDFGVCGDVLRQMDLPVLGVCLGCQGLGSVFGARVVNAPEPMHGRASVILHDGDELFADIPQAFTAIRYHSLVVDGTLPACLRRIAWTEDGIVMGLRHRARPLWGVQFHPESIGTEQGHALLKNFCRLTAAFHALRPERPTTTHGLRASGGQGGPRPVDSDCKRPPREGAIPRAQLRWQRVALPGTAEDLFCGLYGDATHAVWLDSSRPDRKNARFSFMGVPDTPGDIWRYDIRARCLLAGDGTRRGEGSVDLFAALRAELAVRHCPVADLPFDFQGGPVGYFGYEMKAACGYRGAHGSPHPDAAFIWLERFLAVDHAESVVYAVCIERSGTHAPSDAWLKLIAQKITDVKPAPAMPIAALAGAPMVSARPSRSEPQYRRDIAECQRLIREGESYEICLTDTLHVAERIDPLRLHRLLRRSNPAPFAALLQFPDFAVVSSSPERFLRLDRDRVIETKPIKGTCRRGANAAEDETLREALQQSVKTRAENLMIVDLMRNDLGIVCTPGSVQVPVLMQVETFATVHQLVSTVRGRVRPDVDAVACVQQTFPAGSMTGAPKRRTMEILDRLEQEARGIYSGVIGYFGYNGTAEFSVVIRTAVVDASQVTVGTGGAIVALSSVEDEVAEMTLKADVLLRVIAAVRQPQPA
ncbi:MAG: aminodeoxychorismate synthase component I [Verrucomicrobia bacterium]|nr:aminodeoxychorismate synthase component I [Verrucomicrobiota bacterium]